MLQSGNGGGGGRERERAKLVKGVKRSGQKRVHKEVRKRGSEHLSPSPTSNIMLFNARLLDNLNVVSACVKLRSKFRDSFVNVDLPPVCEVIFFFLK